MGAGEKKTARRCVYSEWDRGGEIFTEQLGVMTRSGVVIELEFLKTLNSWVRPSPPPPLPSSLWRMT